VLESGEALRVGECLGNSWVAQKAQKALFTNVYMLIEILGTFPLVLFELTLLEDFMALVKPEPPELEQASWRKRMTPWNILMGCSAVVTLWPVVAPHLRQFIELGIWVLEWLKGLF
jgi:hypothetical protein